MVIMKPVLRVKIYSHKTNNFLKCVFIVMLTMLTMLSNHNIYALFGRLKQFAVVLKPPYSMRHSVILWNRPSMNSGKK